MTKAREGSSFPFAPAVVSRKALDRRTFLRGAGVAVALPALEAMVPALARADEADRPVRMLAICNNLGLLSDQFFPEEAGHDYAPSPYLQMLEPHRKDFTVLSGVSHPEVDGGHPADICFLTGAPHPGRGGFRNTISLDQYAAEHIGHLTRFPSLTLGVNVAGGNRGISWTGAGVLIPAEERASEVFKRLFVTATGDEIVAQERRLQLGKSILDAIADQAKVLMSAVGPRDKERMDQYLTGVRDLEKRLELQKQWERRPKPRVNAEPPVDPNNPKLYFDKIRLMYDMAKLAFETDSTRLITLMLDSVSSPAVEVEGIQIKDGYHNLSHHGRAPEKLEQLAAIDRMHMKRLSELFFACKAVHEGPSTLLDSTMILYGSNLGNAHTHVTTNLPILFAGGGFRHGQHLAFDRERNHPLATLFVSMLQRLGVPADRFSTGKGTMKGLELANV